MQPPVSKQNAKTPRSAVKSGPINTSDALGAASA
jgi:hypothetical protein